VACLPVPLSRKPAPSWDREGAAVAPVQLPALGENETSQCSGWWRFDVSQIPGFRSEQGGELGLSCEKWLCPPCPADPATPPHTAAGFV